MGLQINETAESRLAKQLIVEVPDFQQLYKDSLDKAATSVILSALGFHQYHMGKTAKSLGYDRKTLYNKLRKLNIPFKRNRPQ